MRRLIPGALLACSGPCAASPPCSCSPSPLAGLRLRHRRGPARTPRPRCCSTSRPTRSTRASTSPTERGYDDGRGRRAESGAGRVDRRAQAAEAGRADMAILDIHDLGLAREQGHDIVGVMAFVQRPLAAVHRRSRRSRSPKRPRGQARRRDRPAVRRRGAALDRGRRRRRPGQGAHRRRSASRRSRRCSPGASTGATAFWNVEGVALRARAARDPGVPRRRLRRAELPGARAGRDARRRSRTTRPVRGDDPRAAARLRRGAARPGERGRGDARPSSRGSTRRRSRAQLDAVDAAFTAGAGGFGRLAPRRARRVGGVGRRVRDPERAARRRRARSTSRWSGRRQQP